MGDGVGVGVTAEIKEACCIYWMRLIMVRIDNSRCNGCGNCIDACPQQAISLHDGRAIINQELCIQCLACAESCPVGAIREVVPTGVQVSEGGDSMSYGYGRGFGFRGASPPWPYTGRGRGGLPRCWSPGLWGGALPYATPWTAPYRPTSTNVEELGALKEQADIMKRQLEGIESRIQALEKEG